MEERNFNWNSFPHLYLASDLRDYLELQKLRHGQYCHYTSLRSLNSILEKKQFWLSNVSHFNDCIDSNQFAEVDRQLCFTLCFATGMHENLPLWYLYSGVDGKGARVRFTKDSMRNLLETSKFSLHMIRRHGENSWEIDTSFDAIELTEGQNVEIIFGDIVYSSAISQSESSHIVDLKYNTMTNHKFPKHEFTKYQKDSIGFCKGLIWYYEKETRLLARLTNEAAKVVLDYENDDDQTRYVVILEFDENAYRRLIITLAPEATSIDEAANNYAAIKQFLNTHPNNIHLSDHQGTLHMKTCDRCKYKGK